MITVADTNPTQSDSTVDMDRIVSMYERTVSVSFLNSSQNFNLKFTHFISSFHSSMILANKSPIYR